MLPVLENYRIKKIHFDTSKVIKEKDTKILDRIFAKQLKDIEIDEDRIYHANYQRLLFEMNIEEFKQNGIVSNRDIEILEQNALNEWRNEFEEIYIDEDYSNKSAKKLFYKTMKKKLKLAGEDIEILDAINGKFISLSDIPKIGWKYSWEKDYKDDNG